MVRNDNQDDSGYDELLSRSRLAKGLAALEFLSKGRSSASELARVLQVDRSTGLRLLNELEMLRYVRRHHVSGQYELVAEKIYHLLPREPTGRNSIDDIRELLLRLRDESGESAMFAVAAETSMVYMEFVPSLFPISVREERGSLRPMETSAVGRAYLSTLDQASLSEMFRHLERKSSRLSLKDLRSLRHEVTITRLRGYAIDLENTFPGVNCVAAPLFARGLPIGAIGLSGPSDRLTPKQAERWGKTLRDILTNRDITQIGFEGAKEFE